MGIIRRNSQRVLRLLRYFVRKMVFLECHYSVVIKKPILITPRCVKLGRNVMILNNARIEGVNQYNNINFHPIIVISDGVSIQQNLHLTCANSVFIGTNTAIAANVTITDIHHPYENINIPIEQQNIVVKSVEIGSDCKLYNNVVILPGAKIGRHVTIGANSVVTHEIPSYSVAVGAPARVIRSYNFDTNTWERVM